MKRTSSPQRAAWIATLLMEQPMTIREMLDEMGLDRHDSSKVRAYIDAFRKAGCVYILDWIRPNKYRPKPVPRYVWQDLPFKSADAPEPIEEYA